MSAVVKTTDKNKTVFDLTKFTLDEERVRHVGKITITFDKKQIVIDDKTGENIIFYYPELVTVYDTPVCKCIVVYSTEDDSLVIDAESGEYITLAGAFEGEPVFGDDLAVLRTNNSVQLFRVSTLYEANVIELMDVVDIYTVGHAMCSPKASLSVLAQDNLYHYTVSLMDDIDEGEMRIDLVKRQLADHLVSSY